MWTDSHCHLHDEEDPALGYLRAVESGVDRIVLVGTGEESSRRAVAVAGQLSALGRGTAYATVGLHPHDAQYGLGAVESVLERVGAAGLIRSSDGGVVAVGECGLDYHYEHSPREAQLEVFAAQIELAKRHGLALVVHTRDAWDDTFAVLGDAGVPERLIIHCFTGGPVEARRCLDVGAYLSFSGIVTFKNATDVREAAQLCPQERLLTETDAPYLAPVPHRGRPNEPAYVTIVGEALASVRGESPEVLAAATSENASSVFLLA